MPDFDHEFDGTDFGKGLAGFDFRHELRRETVLERKEEEILENCEAHQRHFHKEQFDLIMYLHVGFCLT